MSSRTLRLDLHLVTAGDKDYQAGNEVISHVPCRDRAQPIDAGRGQLVSHGRPPKAVGNVRAVRAACRCQHVVCRTVPTPAERRALGTIQAELARAIRYDDESIVHPRWVRQRYDCGCYASLAPARQATVRTAWHEAGHAVAALAVGARFSSASIHHGHRSEGRVHGITGATEQAFLIDAAGQIAERLMGWTMLGTDHELRGWLSAWRQDGGDARRFRQSIAARFGTDEVAAWRYCEAILTPRRLEIRQVARALLVHPRHLPYNVAAEISGGTGVARS